MEYNKINLLVGARLAEFLVEHPKALTSPRDTTLRLLIHKGANVTSQEADRGTLTYGDHWKLRATIENYIHLLFVHDITKNHCTSSGCCFL